MTELAFTSYPRFAFAQSGFHTDLDFIRWYIKINGLEPCGALVSLPGSKNKSRSSLYSAPCETHIHFQPKAGTTILAEFLLFSIVSPKGSTNFRIKVIGHKLLFISKSPWSKCFNHHLIIIPSFLPSFFSPFLPSINIYLTSTTEQELMMYT